MCKYMHKVCEPPSGILVVFMDILKWIENWYSEQCDGDWEHEYGINITTLDNPGWSVKIDLTGTGRTINLPFERHENSESDWYDIAVKDSVFSAAGDPTKLAFLLEKFKALIDNSAT